MTRLLSALARYCILLFEGYEQQTAVINSNLNPVWNDEQFVFDVAEFYGESKLKIELFDKVCALPSRHAAAQPSRTVWGAAGLFCQGRLPWAC